MNEQDLQTMFRMLDKVETDGECLIWTGSKSKSGHPQINVWGTGCTMARREMYRIVKGDLQRGVPIGVKCGNAACINPAHLAKSTCSKIALKAAASAVKSVTRSAKIAVTMRKTAKLTIEKVREIRASDETCAVLALRYGVNKSMINRIRRGLAWTDYTNPYFGLMAA